MHENMDYEDNSNAGAISISWTSY